MNDILATFGLLDWKPVAAALLLPPVPLLLMLLLAWWWQRRRPATSTLLLMTAVIALWFSQCQITGELLERRLVQAPTLSTQRLAELRRSSADGRTAIVVLAAGIRPLASEYGESHPGRLSMERLEYAMWLSRQLSAPLLVSGGPGWAHRDGPAEAPILARVASREHGRSVRWIEADSHDTRSMARFSMQMLRQAGVNQVILVTHGWHMQRAARAFVEEDAHSSAPMRLVQAPMGMAVDRLLPAMQRWTPTAEGALRVRQALREWVGLAAGA